MDFIEALVLLFIMIMIGITSYVSYECLIDYYKKRKK